MLTELLGRQGEELYIEFFVLRNEYFEEDTEDLPTPF